MAATTVYQRNWKLLQKVLPGIHAERLGYAFKLEAPGFMDLHVDVLDRERIGRELTVRIAIAHRYVQNGDSMADPDMELRLYPDRGLVEALSFRQDGVPRIGTLYQEVYPEPGKVYPRIKQQLNAFLATWLRNLVEQGHRLPTAPVAPPENPPVQTRLL